MKKQTILFVLLVMTISSVMAQMTGGKYIENGKLRSTLLKEDRNYSIYLPPNYESSDRNYPVLYLLHGAGDNHTSWEQFGEMKSITDKAIANGTATPMIIVMPDARAGYFNNVMGTWPFEDFFFKEFIPHIEKTYRVRSEKQFRAVAGLSMGGGGAIGYVIRHPEMFSVSCPLSAAPGPRDYNEFITRTRDRFGEQKVALIPEADLLANYKTQNLIECFAAMDEAQLEKMRSIKWYFDCGDEDNLSGRLGPMHTIMLDKKIPHEYRIRDGRHNWSYWRTSLPDVLKFTSSAFHR